MEVSFKDDWDIEVSLPVAEQIIPALSEILSNIIKHSQATKISFTLSQQSNKYIIVITDNGVGMDLKVHQKSRGLSNINDRLNHVGSYMLDSELENGTRYAITVDI